MLRGIERLFGIFAGLSGPIWVAWTAFQVHQADSCVEGRCTRISTSSRQDNRLETIAYLVGSTVTGLAIAALVYWHSAGRASTLLGVLWLLVPVFFTSVVLLAFTPAGDIAFFYGIFTVLAAIVGTVRQNRRCTQVPTGGNA